MSPRAKSAHSPRKRAGTTPAKRKWSHRVMQTSDALDLAPGVFRLRSARAVAQSLKRSAEASTRRKSSPFRSAMSMLSFEINRAGTNLSPRRRLVLNQAKVELRKAFHRPPKSRPHRAVGVNNARKANTGPRPGRS